MAACVLCHIDIPTSGGGRGGSNIEIHSLAIGSMGVNDHYLKKLGEWINKPNWITQVNLTSTHFMCLNNMNSYSNEPLANFVKSLTNLGENRPKFVKKKLALLG